MMRADLPNLFYLSLGNNYETDLPPETSHDTSTETPSA